MALKQTVKANFIRLVNPATGEKGAWVAYDEAGDDVCVNITGHQFDSYEVYHVAKWAEERGLKAELVTVDVQLPA